MICVVGASDDDEFSLWQRGLLNSVPHPSKSQEAAPIYAPILKHRGGDAGCDPSSGVCSLPARSLEQLKAELGNRFSEALALNEEEHKRDCAKSCELFYCGEGKRASSGREEIEYNAYAFGSVPPEDFADQFDFPMDLIKVTATKTPLLTSMEASRVVKVAEDEGVLDGEYDSGKYKLGGDWLDNLPKTREWFNELCANTVFPELARLFPDVISSPAVLRAHSVALLRYNSSHPRTDVHVDNGVFAITLALSPSESYEGGGTFFEHLGRQPLEMDVGGATFRPGSVRHGGAAVKAGERYILGAFMLIEDRVEHVRRLKNRGAERRRAGDEEGARELFHFALAINPRCVTCLKDLAELETNAGNLNEASRHLMSALDLTPDDSDALFSLGVLRTKQNRTSDALESYRKAATLCPDDHEVSPSHTAGGAFAGI